MTNKIETGAGPRSAEEPTLHRSIGPTQMALYGLGSMLGSVLGGVEIFRNVFE